MSQHTAGGLRLLLALAYPLLAHLAGARHDPALAAIALADLSLVVLLHQLLQHRIGAWLLLAAIAMGLFALAQSHYALLPLLLVPVALLGLVAWTFGRTLRRGRMSLITQIVAALDAMPASALAPELRSYTRNLTAAWAGLLGALALANLVLAMLAVPDGLLASLGVTPPLTVSEGQWSWFANILNWGIVVGFFVGEYLVRKRRFPGRYHSLLDFLQRMARLGPAFWRQLLH
ncbi:MAG: ketosynthase [Luteimonas sp.]